VKTPYTLRIYASTEPVVATMEWKLKMMLSMAFLVIIFADIFGYGNAKSM
jgi:hypothetical protein